MQFVDVNHVKVVVRQKADELKDVDRENCSMVDSRRRRLHFSQSTAASGFHPARYLGEGLNWIAPLVISLPFKIILFIGFIFKRYKVGGSFKFFLVQ